MRFRSKVVEIEAVQISKRMDILSPPWWYEAVSENRVRLHHMGKFADAETPYVAIDTLEGTMRGDEGDWIIRGLKGELYPCKPDVFAMKYESCPATPLPDQRTEGEGQ